MAFGMSLSLLSVLFFFSGAKADGGIFGACFAGIDYGDEAPLIVLRGPRLEWDRFSGFGSTYFRHTASMWRIELLVGFGRDEAETRAFSSGAS